MSVSQSWDPCDPNTPAVEPSEEDVQRSNRSVADLAKEARFYGEDPYAPVEVLPLRDPNDPSKVVE